MKRRLFTFALAALTIGLLGSCSKINERIDSLDKRVYDLENTKIASIEQQIAAINQSIADLETIRTNIQNLKNEQEAQGQDITDLQAKDQALEGKINDLRTYVNTELSKYATTEWANATFATLAVQADIIKDVEKLKADLADLDTKLDQDIANLKTYIEGWVNTQLSAYYKKAEIDDKVGELQAQITTLKEDNETNKTKIEELESNLNKLTQDLKEAQATIKIEYEAAIKKAIEDYNGTITETIQSKIDEVNATITALTGRVDDLETAVGLLTGRIDAIEAMIQSVSITPAYSDGSVEAVNGILTLKCIVSPAEALIGMESLKDSLLIYADYVKVKTKSSPAYAKIAVGEATVLDAEQGAITLKADISEYLPEGEDKALTVAVNIKNGISDFTTEFVSVTPIVEYVEIAAKYDGSTVSTLRWYRQSLAITESGKKAWKDDSGSPVKVPGTDEDVVVGDYFQWGTFTGFYGNGAGTDKGLLTYTSFTSTGCGDGSDAFTFKDGKEFNQTNAPYWSGSAYTKYNTTDGKTELDASDDVASIILGGTWRMPTTKEFQALKEVTYWAWDATDKGYYVYTPNPASDAGKVNDGTGTYNKADALLFFPAAGNGYEDTYWDAGYLGDFWTGSLNSAKPAKGCILYLNGGEGRIDAASDDSDRYRGYSVRPVQDPAATYEAVTNVSLDVTAKEIEKGGNVQIKVTVAPATATQNGVYWTSSAPTVATVDATGKVTAVAAGTATITATTVDGTKTATCTVTVLKEVKTMADILKTTTGIPESQNLTPPANAWVNSTDPDCKAFVGIDAEGDKLFVILKEGSGLTPLGICMDDEFEKIDDNTYKRVEESVGTFTIKMTEGKFTSYEFTAASGSASEQFNGTYSAPVLSPTFKAVYNTTGGANTLTFYYDTNDHSGDGITVYDNLPTAATKASAWGYNSNRANIKSVVIDASVADYKGLTSTAFMFQGMTTATNISGAEYLDVLNVTDMSFMFNNFGGGKSGSPTTLNVVPDVSQWNTGNVTNMTAMFESYGNFSSSLDKVPDVSGWNTGNVTNMFFMFQKYGHESQNFNAVPDVSKWNTGKVEDMHQMFFEYGHKSTALNTVPDVSKWKTGNVTNMSGMFNGYGYTSTNISCVLDLSGWDLSKITGTNGANVFNFNPKTFKVTIPAKTGEKSNEGGKWYYGNGTNHIAPPAGKTFTLLLPPAGPLKGEFSVSATKKVRFSQGNLWADASGASPVFYFETNQYDFQSSWSTSHVSHFFWSKDASVAYAASYSESGTAATEVFFTNATAETAKSDFTVNGVTGKYRTLSTNEWQYLFNTRTMKNGKDRYTPNITYGGKMGLVLYPDDYDNDPIHGSVETMPEGVVFLPAAGDRIGSYVYDVGGVGIYWSSSAYDEGNAYYVFLDSGSVIPDYSDGRRNGFSVRLVTEVPAAGDPGNGTEQYKNNNPDWF